MDCKHIAIIMDGNGRWAQTRALTRPWGHRRGAQRVDEIVTACVERGVSYLTLYAFSTENWNRPEREVNLLMRLLVKHLRTMDKKLVKNRVSLVAQGSLDRLPDFVRAELNRVIELTAFDSPSMTLCLCLSYGARQELVDATKEIARRVEAGETRIDSITESDIQNALYQPSFPDPDLLIRTGGEFRVSNFLLWQIAYAEIYVTPVLWPDFDAAQLDRALRQFSGRERRFGRTSAQVQSMENRA